ncbi:hypothetical protein P8452_65301 [Trifolium repens]|nr:hypothetical protein P8452_65301 [Trifolium repens]
MGCGISTMDGGYAPGARLRRGRVFHPHANVPQPSVDNDIDNHEATRKEEGFNGERLKEEKNKVDRKEEERGVFVNYERQGKLEEDINISNGFDDSTKPRNGKSLHSNKHESEKKERRGRGGFRNVIYKGLSRGGRRNFLNFACHNSTQSYAEGSFNKVVTKTT